MSRGAVGLGAERLLTFIGVDKMRLFPAAKLHALRDYSTPNYTSRPHSSFPRKRIAAGSASLACLSLA